MTAFRMTLCNTLFVCNVHFAIMAVEVSCSFVSENSPCGLTGIGSTIVPISACTLDMTSHLISLQVTGKRGGGKASVSERELILNRAGLLELTRQEELMMTICPKHRKSLTTDWQGRKSRACSYPAHVGKRKQLQHPRRVNAPMSVEIHQMFASVVPIGSGKWSLFFIARNIYFDFGSWR